MLSELKNKIKKKLGFYNRNFWLFWLNALPLKFFKRTYKTSNVLLLRLDLLGDCAMFSSTAEEICSIYQGRKIDVICLSSTKPIFERIGKFNKIITLDCKPHCPDYTKVSKLIRELKSNAYDILLQPQVSKLPIADILAASVKCNHRYTIETKPGNSSTRWIAMVNWLYDKRFPYPQGWKNEFDYYASFIHGLGFPDFQSRRPSLKIKEQHFIKARYYVVYPGASYLQRAWEPFKFAEVIDYIYKKTGLVAVILGCEWERKIAEAILAKTCFLSSCNIINLMGKTSVYDVIDIIGNSEFTISNDTSGVHIACATNTPSVALVGGGHFERFLPYDIQDLKPNDNSPFVAYKRLPCYHCDWNWALIEKRNPSCLKAMQQGVTVDCISAITVSEVLPILDKILQSKHLVIRK